MLLGARQFFERRGAPAWTNPYVTDGLVAMWDGEWNAGGGVHDASATTWVDLINGHTLNVDTGGSFGDNCLICDGTARGAYGNNLAGDAPVTVEAVVKRDDSASSWRIMWHQSVWTVGPRLARCLVFVDPTHLWLASAYGYVDLSTVISSPTSVSTTYGTDSIASVIVNGAVGSPVSGSTSWYASDGGSVFEFGGKTSTGNQYAIACKIFSFRLYSRPLMAAEVADNYAVDKRRFDLP